MSDKLKWINLVEVQITQELMKIEEAEMFKEMYHQNYLRKENTSYLPYTEGNVTYRTPKYEEFVVGFKCESNYWYFSKNEDREWVEAEITEDNIQDVKELWRNDAYPTEFRIKI